MRWQVFDLYCGLGGLGLGFKNAGFDCRGGIDFWEPAVAHNSRLLGHVSYHEKVENADEIILESGWKKETGILVGGPPCQGFSLANQRRSSERGAQKRSELFNYVDLINRLKPAAFLLENVGGMKDTKKNAESAQSTVTGLTMGDYDVAAKVLNASDYGVPQTRRRTIFLGFRRDLIPEDFDASSAFPQATHHDFCKKVNSINERFGFAESADETRDPKYWKDKFFKGILSPTTHELWNRLPAVNVKETISDLPALKAGENSEVLNHSSGRISEIVGVRIGDIPPGGNVFAIKKENLHGLNPEDSWYNYKRMNWVCRPAPAIPCEIRAANGYAHPTQARAITPREAARLQGFPDDFELKGPAKDQYRLVGNAVPPLLAQCIAESMLMILNSL